MARIYLTHHPLNTTVGPTEGGARFFGGDATAIAATEERADTLRDHFRDLADLWHDATDALSSPDAKTEHPAYQKTIVLGQSVLRYILADLRDRGGHWFVALEEITGIQPQLPAGVLPSVQSERQAWLDWGRAHRLLD